MTSSSISRHLEDHVNEYFYLLRSIDNYASILYNIFFMNVHLLRGRIFELKIVTDDISYDFYLSEVHSRSSFDF